MARKNKLVHQNSKIIAKETVLIDQLLQKCLEYSNKPNQTADEFLEEFVDLATLVDQIRELQVSTFEKILPKKERSVSISKFISWCKKQNLIDEKKLEFFVVDEKTEQYGLRSLVDINENDLLISIPRKYMLTTECALKDSNFGQLLKEDSVLRAMPNVSLSLFVVEEKCKKFDSFWKTYLDSCPTTFSTTLYFNRSELELLKKSPSFEQAIKIWRNICRQYAYFYQKMLNPLSNFNKLVCVKYFTFDLYRWAVSLVMTRHNFIPSEENENQMIDSLIPLWDMLNHEHGKLSTQFDVEKDEAVCSAMKNFKAGQEMKMYYGNRSNAEFLIYSGFVDEQNQNDYLMIKLGISKNDALYKQKAALLEKLNISKSGSFKKLKHKNNPIDCELLAFLRVFYLDENELDHYLQLSNQELDDLFKTECKLWKEIDHKIQQFITMRAKLMLRNYSIDSTVKDQKQKAPETLNSSNVLLLLSLEKKILESYL